MRKWALVGIAVLALAGTAVMAAPHGKGSRRSTQQLVGNIVSVNSRTRIFTVSEPVKDGEARQVVFKLDIQGKIQFEDKVGRLDELLPGDIVTVSYRMSEGQREADKVEVARKARPAVPPKPAS